ncbi:hypothetical protein AVEN_79548-1 [Araneus ventricosus]|uniref:Uncharacterized protein n=1 Tax=Araneus ventricosus TaxID=182803 RepID=A0A4Y2KPY9_ARAVE|nr:hypothetical protein AVEN_79548-1 [Araneus ventricosus]
MNPKSYHHGHKGVNGLQLEIEESKVRLWPSLRSLAVRMGGSQDLIFPKILHVLVHGPADEAKYDILVSHVEFSDTDTAKNAFKYCSEHGTSHPSNDSLMVQRRVLQGMGF